MVAGALGIGFVLGGGLFTRLSAKILGVGLRVALMAALPVLGRQVGQALSGSKLAGTFDSDALGVFRTGTLP